MRNPELLLCLAFWLLVSCFAKSETIEAGNLRISKASEELVIEFEVGGRAYYEGHLKRPEVPPGASGTTVGLGLDLGYNTPDQIRDIFKGRIPDAQIERLCRVAGKTGASARAALPSVKDISIPWDVAWAIYKEKTVPRFAKLTEQAYPGITKMNPDIQGVMLSTSFNRGTAMAGDRRRELRWSRDDIALNKTSKLPSYQLQMRRLWPSIRGLQRRYTAHAALMQRSLDGP